MLLPENHFVKTGAQTIPDRPSQSQIKFECFFLSLLLLGSLSRSYFEVSPDQYSLVMLPTNLAEQLVRLGILVCLVCINYTE